MKKEEEKYINPLTDFGFKKLFGTELNKDLLIDFLNELLPNRKVKDLTYSTNEHFGKYEIDRKAIFDIYCIGENEERFIVEMQKAKQNYFKDRSVFYASFPIQEQAKRGDWDYRLEPVFSIGILDFEFDEHKQDKDLLHIVELKNQKCEVFYDKLKFIYIELPKFKKKPSELETHFDKWLYVFTHLQKLSNRPKELQERVFKKIFEVAEIAGFTEEERKEYEESLKTYRDIRNVVDTAKAEGIAEGKIEGKIEKEEEVIERCMEENMQVEVISKIVNLPIAEVKKIIEKIKKRKEVE
ncbi:MAG: Rpn family recombination-promoting nuclease/putative transposase [Saprospiraceae bacterium]